MINNSPLLWAVKLVKGRCSMWKATRRQHECQLQCNVTNMLTRRPFAPSQSRKKKKASKAHVLSAKNVISESKTHRNSTCTRAYTPRHNAQHSPKPTRRLTVETVEWWRRTNNQSVQLTPSAPSHRSLIYPLLLLPLPKRREFPSVPSPTTSPSTLLNTYGTTLHAMTLQQDQQRHHSG